MSETQVKPCIRLKRDISATYWLLNHLLGTEWFMPIYGQQRMERLSRNGDVKIFH